MICTALRAVMICQACGLDKKRSNPQGHAVVDRAYDLDYTPLCCKCAVRPWCYALCSSVTSQHRSNLRRLADKRACRLGFTWLSAPSRCDGARGDKSLLLRHKEKKRANRKGMLSFLAEKERFGLSRRKNPTYTLSRGASSTT